LISLTKRLSHHGITFGQYNIRMAEKFSTEMECHKKVPLYFIPSSDQNSRQFLLEVNDMSINSVLQQLDRQVPCLLSCVTIRKTPMICLLTFWRRIFIFKF
jgi:hypothetical protein